MHAPFDKEVERNLASSGQDSLIGFPTREPPPPKAKASIQLQSTPAQLKREPSPLVFYPPHRLSAFRTGGDARDLGIMELCAEPQQRLTQLHRARACCSRKREENSPWPPPVSAAICLTSASTIVPGEESTFLSRRFESDMPARSRSPTAGA